MPGAALPDWVQDYADQKVFVCWGYRRTKSGKRTKPPLMPSGYPASSNDPTTWVTLEEALVAIERQGTIDGKTLQGVGIMLDGNDRLLAFDLDRCYDDQAGKLAPWAHETIAQLQTYTEITPSQKGIRAIGTVPPGWRGPIHRDVTMDQNGGHMEIFHNCARFITISGDLLPGAPDELVDISGPAADIIARLLPQEEARPAAAPARAKNPLPVHIDELCEVVWRISPEIDRQKWVGVALALKWEAGERFAEAAKQLFLEWSFSSETWGKDNAAGGAEACWESAQPDGRVTFGKLVYLVREHPQAAAWEQDAATGKGYVPLKRELWEHPEVRGRSAPAKVLLIELLYRYTGQNNGQIRMSWDEAQALLGCSRRMVGYYFAELHRVGLIEITVKGSFDHKAGARKGTCNLYRLTRI